MILTIPYLLLDLVISYFSLVLIYFTLSYLTWTGLNPWFIFCTLPSILDSKIEPFFYTVKWSHIIKMEFVTDSWKNMKFVGPQATRCLPCTPRKNWHHSGTRRTCPGRRSRVCRHEVEVVERVSWAPSPLNWCSGSPPLQRGAKKTLDLMKSLHTIYTTQEDLMSARY